MSSQELESYTKGLQYSVTDAGGWVNVHPPEERKNAYFLKADVTLSGACDNGCMRERIEAVRSSIPVEWKIINESEKPLIGTCGRLCGSGTRACNAYAAQTIVVGKNVPK